MLQLLRAWINGSKDYFKGVALYQQVGDNENLLALFKKGQTPFTKRRLEEILLEICLELKVKEYGQRDKGGDDSSEEEIEATLHVGTPRNHKHNLEHANNDLYAAAKLQADKYYKEVMNARAVLFAMVNSNDITEPNTQDKINLRGPMALQVVTGFNDVSKLYDKADYVKEHGHLPDQEPDESNEYDLLPATLVKQTLDNLRKNFNKMKMREATPERVALLLKHKANIEKLEIRWASLKSVI